MKKNHLIGIGLVLFFLSLTFNGLSIGYNTYLGTLNPGGTITQSGSTVGYTNVYGNGSPDYVYCVYISGATTLTVNTCGCGWDSYLHVLNASDTRLGYDDDACGGNSSQISGLSIPSAGYYFIVVDGYSSSNSGSYTLSISSTGGSTTLTGGTISIGSNSICTGSSPGTITNSVSPSGGTGSYTYQWYQSADNSNWAVIYGAVSLTYSVPNLSATTYIRRLTLSGTLAVYSNTLQISVTSCGTSVTSVNGYTGAVTLGLSNYSSGTQRTIGITNGAGTTIDVADNDNSSTNELQSLSVSGSTLSISGGNSVTLPTATYPGAGIPVSTGSGWTTSITNNSANWNTAYNWGNHAGLYRPISYVPAWNEITSKPTTISGYGISDAMTTSHAANSITLASIATWNAKQGALTITNTGTSGAATLVGNTLNIPQYSGGSGASSQWTTSGPNIYYNTTGGVSIATTSLPTGYKLAVGGKIIAEEVMVKTVGTWPDYVFGKDYPLKPLSEVENYIMAYGHLPEVPSAQEVKEKGVGLSKIDQVLLKKVEEMTLYILELEKRVKKLEK